MVLINSPAGVQQHGASVTAGAQSHNLRVPPGAQGPAGGQGDQEREPGQLQHERQELEDRIPRDVSPSYPRTVIVGCVCNRIVEGLCCFSEAFSIFSVTSPDPGADFCQPLYRIFFHQSCATGGRTYSQFKHVVDLKPGCLIKKIVIGQLDPDYINYLGFAEITTLTQV